MDTTDAPQRNRWWLVVGAGAAVFMAQLDVTVVNVALPTIERDFGTSTSVTEWVILGYVLPLIALTLPSGRWLEGVGRRAAMVFSVGGFATASVAVGLAPDIGWLIAARAAQGSFGAVLFALIPVLAIGLLLVLPLDPEWTTVDLAWRLAITGAGAGLFAGPNQTVAMSTAPAHLVNTTGATTSVARQLGIALGPALVTASWALSGDAMRLSVGLAAALAALSVLALVRRAPHGTATEPTTERTPA